MRILVPLDGSEGAEAILPIIVDLAREGVYDLDLLRVVKSPDRRGAAEAYLGQVREDLAGKQVRAVARVVCGDPGEEIVREARGNPPDGVALTMLRRGPAARVSASLLGNSPVPLIVARPGVRRGDWTRLVVGLDGFAGAEEVLSAAVGIAGRMRATIHLLHIGLPILPFDDRKGAISVPRSKAEAYLKGVCERLEARKIPAIPRKREGAPGPAICRYAEEIDAGLICVASAECGSGEGVTESILRGAPCPVWVCPRDSRVDPQASDRRVMRV